MTTLHVGGPVERAGFAYRVARERAPRQRKLTQRWRIGVLLRRRTSGAATLEELAELRALLDHRRARQAAST